jgi:hypothetical protein
MAKNRYWSVSKVRKTSHGVDRKTFEVTTSTYPLRTIGSFLDSRILYHGNYDKNHKLWNIVSTERYILHMLVLLECCYIYAKFNDALQWTSNQVLLSSIFFGVIMSLI